MIMITIMILVIVNV